MLTTKGNAVTGNKRFTLGAKSDATKEGAVAVGVDRNEHEFLVHTVGRQTEAIALHAVATAIGNGRVIPVEDIVSVVTECGNLPKLAAAVEKALGKPKSQPQAAQAGS